MHPPAVLQASQTEERANVINGAPPGDLLDGK